MVCCRRLEKKVCYGVVDAFVVMLSVEYKLMKNRWVLWEEKEIQVVVEDGVLMC